MKSHMFVNLALLLLAIYIAIVSYTLRLGTLRNPGPGFFPFGGALLIGICAIVVLYGGLSRKVPGEPGAVEKTNWRNVLCIPGAVVVFALLANSLGFFVCTFLIFIFFQRFIASQSWTKSMMVAICAAAGTYIVFNVLLDSQLPKGFFNF